MWTVAIPQRCRHCLKKGTERAWVAQGRRRPTTAILDCRWVDLASHPIRTVVARNSPVCYTVCHAVVFPRFARLISSWCPPSVRGAMNRLHNPLSGTESHKSVRSFARWTQSTLFFFPLHDREQRSSSEKPIHGMRPADGQESVRRGESVSLLDGCACCGCQRAASPRSLAARQLVGLYAQLVVLRGH